MTTFFSFFGRDHKGQALHFNLFWIRFPFATLRAIQKRISASILHAGIPIATMIATSTTFGQEISKDTIKPAVSLDEVIISAVRADDKAPVTFSNLSKRDLAKRNLGQDIPTLLNFLPSVVTTSDAGAGIGYTGIRVRGSDATRVNVTVNGIPYNDSESHGTFWVNMPDFTSSVENLQLQRGVGTSTNGSGAFGASLNLLTDSYSPKATGEISNSFGSFNTRKHTVKFSTGLLNDHFEIAGRLSNIHSDGFIDRAESELKGYFLQGTFIENNTLIKALVFGGTEKTYQAWNGLEDPEKLRNDRTYNTAGEYVDDNNQTRFYDNETDNYKQDHYQLHWNQKWSALWHTNLAFHYTKGRGYYENYKQAESVSEYGIEPQIISGVEIDVSDLIRQKWLDNDFFGTTFSVNYKSESLEIIVGGGANKYEGSHFGKVLWTRDVILPSYNLKYYDDFSTKTDINVFAKATYQLSTKFSLFGDMQYRSVKYKANSDETGNVDDSFNFFNPKAGLTFTVNANSNIYASFARANREPNRNDYESGSPRPERLDDYELGYRYKSKKTRLNINAYYMRYQDQLVLTGALDDVGAPIRENSGNSYRLGVETDVQFAISNKISWQTNFTVSANKNEDFVFVRDGIVRNLGDTNIAFSPNVIIGNIVTYAPIRELQFSLLTKFVGEQYMANIDSDASKLDSYGISDFSVNYTIRPKSIFESIVISGLLNNIFDYEYESNGYFYTFDDDSTPGIVTTIEGAGYYPQAGINFLVGVTLKF